MKNEQTKWRQVPIPGSERTEMDRITARCLARFPVLSAALVTRAAMRLGLDVLLRKPGLAASAGAPTGDGAFVQVGMTDDEWDALKRIGAVCAAVKRTALIRGALRIGFEALGKSPDSAMMDGLAPMGALATNKRTA